MQQRYTHVCDRERYGFQTDSDRLSLPWLTELKFYFIVNIFYPQESNTDAHCATLKVELDTPKTSMKIVSDEKTTRWITRTRTQNTIFKACGENFQDNLDIYPGRS